MPDGIAESQPAADSDVAPHDVGLPETQGAQAPGARNRGDGLFGGIFARGGVAGEVGDEAWLRAMLDAESALARAEARAGIFDRQLADAISAACRPESFDIGLIGREAARTGNPVAPLVRALTAAVAEASPEAAAHVHRGATSQDILDTAAMLIAKRALGPLLADLDGCAEAAAYLAEEWRSTPMAGRTLLQQALPTTFGLVAAGWLAGLDRAAGRLAAVRTGVLAVQLGGAVGTLASLGTEGIAVLETMAGELDLAVPALPWHTDRSRVAELAGALGAAAGAVAKPALDVLLLAQTEVGEVREGVAGRGGSSTLPGKRNPVAATSARACAAGAPGLVAELLAAMPQELQRGAGTWQVEWRALSSLLLATGSAAAWLRDCLEHLEVDPDRMRANLEGGGGLILAEAVATALSPELGRLGAHEAVDAAAAEASRTGRPFREVLAGDGSLAAGLGAQRIDALLDPATYLGSAAGFVDRALREHATRRSGGTAPR